MYYNVIYFFHNLLVDYLCNDLELIAINSFPNTEVGCSKLDLDLSTYGINLVYRTPG